MLFVCLCVYLCIYVPVSVLSNAWSNLYETWSVYPDIWAHLNGVLHKSLPLVCVSVCASLLWFLGKGSALYIPPFIARQLVGKHVPAAMNTHSSRRIVRRVCMLVCLYIPLPLLGNTSIKTFPRQRIIVGGVVFRAVLVVSKKVGEFLVNIMSDSLFRTRDLLISG
jgi:hypothetical protein